MNKRRIFSCMLAAVFAVLALTSCCGGDPSDPNKTTASSAPTQKPSDTTEDFAERLQDALLNNVRSDTAFDIKETHRYDPSSTMEKVLFAKWTADFSEGENPRFSYSAQRNPNAEDPELLLFYDDGYFYIKDAQNQYCQPASLSQAIGGIPYNALSALFGSEVADVFANADVTENGDGSLAASLELPLEDHADAVKAYLAFFGIDPSGIAYEADGEPYPLAVSVTLSKDGRILSYRVETVMQARRQGDIYPVTYTVNAVCREIGEDFSVPLPDAAAREEYREAEPEIDHITAEEFWERFASSDENASKAVYTEMVTNASAFYEFSDGRFVTVPLLNVTQLDLSDPRAPKISVVETKDMMGLIQKTEIYYKDDTYYFAMGGNRFSRPYPAEEYLANVEASAKEKEEAGVSTIFLTEDMLKNAVLTIGPDQSVSAFMNIDGKTQEKNIFYNIYSLYNDDLSEMQNVAFLETTVSVTIDRFNDMTAYALTATVSAESNGKPAIMKYIVSYFYDYDEKPREIDFPDDLDSWNSSVQGEDEA